MSFGILIPIDTIFWSSGFYWGAVRKPLTFIFFGFSTILIEFSPQCQILLIQLLEFLTKGTEIIFISVLFESLELLVELHLLQFSEIDLFTDILVTLLSRSLFFTEIEFVFGDWKVVRLVYWPILDYVAVVEKVVQVLVVLEVLRVEVEVHNDIKYNRWLIEQ